MAKKRAVNRVGRQVACLIALLNAGCSTTKLYPVCIHEATPDAEARAVWARHKADLDGVLANLVRPDPGGGYVLTSKGAAVTAAPHLHRQLADVWPSLACVGPNLSMGADILTRNCQKHVAMFIDQGWRHWPGDPNEGRLRCLQPE